MSDKTWFLLLAVALCSSAAAFVYPGGDNLDGLLGFEIPWWVWALVAAYSVGQLYERFITEERKP